jgi:transposase
MRGIPEATEITLTVEERQQLEALVRSTKCEARMRFRAWIVLLAAAGIGTREISRRLRCTIGTASKWRVRSARDRLAGLSVIGERGAVAKYGTEHQQRILAMLDRAPPAGNANWTAPLLARELGDMSSISGVSCERRRSICQAASPGARAMTLNLSARPPTSSVST